MLVLALDLPVKEENMTDYRPQNLLSNHEVYVPELPALFYVFMVHACKASVDATELKKYRMYLQEIIESQIRLELELSAYVKSSLRKNPRRTNRIVDLNPPTP